MYISPFKLERFYSRHEFTAKYLLCSSDAESMSIKDLLALEDGATEKLMGHWLGYTETQGAPWLRQEITKLYTSCNPNEILVHSGAQEAIFLCVHALLNKGDHIIVQTPCYQSFISVPESFSCIVSKWEMEYDEEKWKINLAKLESLIQPNTKMLIINTPHNPTCYQFTIDEVNEIIRIARKHNLILLSDEVYRGLEHDTNHIIPAFCDVYENALSLHVMSKSYGLPGLRIGWLASHRKDLLEKIWIFKEYTTICNSAPSEMLAAIALRNADKIIERNLAIVKNNLAILEPFFEKYKALFGGWKRPRAGVTAFVKLKKQSNDDAFVAEVLRSKNVLLLPGTIYNYPGFFRIGFGRSNMPEALEQFTLYLEENK